MYSFSQRPDTLVFDEPLYASYLERNPEISRPYREKLLEVQTKNGAEFFNTLKSKFSSNKTLIDCKHITKQLEGLNRQPLFDECVKNVFLIRDPLDIILSWNDREMIHKEGCSLESLCFPQMVQLFSEIRQTTGQHPIVIDSNLLKTNSREILFELCSKLDIPFYEEQLSWPSGPKPDIDG